MSEKVKATQPLLQTISQEYDQSLAVDLVWRSLSFSIKGKPILRSITGHVPAGANCAIIGPSGSGKTSLLNILAGRVSPTKQRVISGIIGVDGVEIHPSQLRKQIAYVMQEDALTPTTTPREAIRFSAKLRLPQSMPSEEKNKLVEEMITALGLEKCADTMIGGALIKGISGGEKKRTAIGCELVTKPRILFLDEPTSGLDSYTALQVVKILEKISADGCTVLCTIHQPSSEVFEAFSDVISLSRGNAIYNGKMSQFTDHFTKLGYNCPEHHNPADYVLYLSQTLDDSIINEWGTLSSSSLLQSLSEENIKVKRGSVSLARFEVKTASFITQSRYLFDREVKAITRDKATLVARFVIVVLMNGLFAVIFYRVADTNDVVSYLGGIVQMMIGCMMSSSQPLLLTFPIERPIFVREYVVGTYSASSYFITKTVVDLILCFLTTSLAWLIAYWMMDFKGNILILIFSSWLTGIISSSMALMIGSIAKDVKKAIEISPVLFIPQMMFAGFFIKIDQIPVLLRWAQYLCAIKFSLNLAILTEFGDNCAEGLRENNECEKILASNNVYQSEWLLNIIVLVGLFFFYRLSALFFLKQLANF